MSALKDGGPAFPTEPNTQPGFYAHHGMSLRDWFAGLAMEAALTTSSAKSEEFIPILLEAVARLSYQAADAMLKAREATP